MTDQRKRPANGWKPGQSGNPRGRLKGTRNRATQVVMALMEDGAKDIAQVIVEAAKKGDLAAAKLVLDRLAPPVRERPIAIELPGTDTAAGVNEAHRIVLHAVGNGQLLPTEGTAVIAMLESRRRAIETAELEARIAELERIRPAANNHRSTYPKDHTA